MAEEKKEAEKEQDWNLSKGLTTGLVFGIIGAIIGAILSVFTIVDAGWAGMSTFMVLGLVGLGFGFCLGFIYGIFPKKLKMLALLIIIISILLIAYWFFISAKFGTGPLGSYLKPVSIKTEGIGNFFAGFKNYGYCLTGDAKCPFISMWETPKIENSEEKLSVKVSFSNTKIINGEINSLVSLTVNNPEEAELEIIPNCYLDNTEKEKLNIENEGTYWNSDKFVFPSSEYELHTTFRCTGTSTETTEQLLLILERPVIVNTNWPIKIRATAPEKFESPTQSEMTYNAPYTVSLACNEQQPFVMGKEEGYNFEVILKRQYSNVKLKQLNYLRIIVPDEISIECPNFEGNAIENIDYEALKKVADFTPENDRFSFLCSLYVADAPTNAITEQIIAETSYIVESQYKTTLAKQI